MPEQRIQYGGVVHSFPDNFTQADVAKALQVWDQQHATSGPAVNEFGRALNPGSPAYARAQILAGKNPSAVPPTGMGQVRETEHREMAQPASSTPGTILPGIGNAAKGFISNTIGAISPIGSDLTPRVPPLIDALLPFEPSNEQNRGEILRSLRVPPVIDALMPLEKSAMGKSFPELTKEDVRIPPILNPVKQAVRGAGALMGISEAPTDPEFAQAQEQAGGMLGGALTAKYGPPALEKIGELSKPIRAAATSKKALNATTALAEPGVHGAPQPVAQAMQGRFANTIEQLKGPGSIPVKEGIRGEIMGDLYHGATAEQRANMATVLDKPVEQVGPLALEAANKVVSDIHAPMRKIFKDYADVEMPVTAKRIADRIRADAQRLAPPERGIWDQWAAEVESNPTVGGLNHIKENANLAYAKLADRTLPSAQAEGTVTSAQAAKSTADFIRKEMYPQLDKVAPGIADQGRLEAQAWDFRDGVYKTWTEAAKGEAPAALRTWHEKLGVDALRGVMHPGKTTLYTAIKPSTFKTPLQKFNKLISKASSEPISSAADRMTIIGGVLPPEEVPVAPYPEGYGFIEPVKPPKRK